MEDRAATLGIPRTPGLSQRHRAHLGKRGLPMEFAAALRYSLASWWSRNHIGPGTW